MQKLIFHIKYSEDRVELVVNAAGFLKFYIRVDYARFLIDVSKKFKFFAQCTQELRSSKSQK
jgi:hypothetical protein